MKAFIQSLFKASDGDQTKTIRGKYYIRSGYCNGCGRCCKDIYLVHGENTIENIEQFEALKPGNPEYQHFKPVRETEHGVQFQCTHLQEDNTCSIYESRPLFCRQYPNEKSLLLGGTIADECSYTFELVKTFQDVLKDMKPVNDQKKSKALGLLIAPGKVNS